MKWIERLKAMPTVVALSLVLGIFGPIYLILSLPRLLRGRRQPLPKPPPKIEPMLHYPHEHWNHGWFNFSVDEDQFRTAAAAFELIAADQQPAEELVAIITQAVGDYKNYYALSELREHSLRSYCQLTEATIKFLLLRNNPGKYAYYLNDLSVRRLVFVLVYHNSISQTKFNLPIIIVKQSWFQVILTIVINLQFVREAASEPDSP